ncbi:MAG: methyltransferase domain-containing protein [Thermoanaerobaculaceae bacterium]|nr:methyltransferase domain-containing protein [Thermoanaerobaculaceae bacterium]
MDALDRIIDLARVEVPLDAAGLFGAAVPLEVELGAGKGRFLLEWGAAHPGVGLIGVERARTYLEMAARRAARAGLANVRLLHTTAEDLLFRCLANGSVAAVHVYFPDPWPKTRHHKRRFFRPENVARLAEVLVPGGTLRVKTDHDDYAAAIAELLAAEVRLHPVAAAAAFAAVPASNFEVKYAREGRLVHRFAFRRS